MVGGAGSLLVAPGRQLMDEPDVPKKLLPGIRGMAKVYTDLLLPEKSVDWVFLSPGTGKASSGAIYTRVLSVFGKNSCSHSNSCCFTLIMLIFVRK